MENKLPDSCKNDCVYPNCRCLRANTYTYWNPENNTLVRELSGDVISISPSLLCWEPKESNPDWQKEEHDKFGSMSDNASFVDGCVHVWDKYVKPLQEEIERLKKEINKKQI